MKRDMFVIPICDVSPVSIYSNYSSPLSISLDSLETEMLIIPPVSENERRIKVLSESTFWICSFSKMLMGFFLVWNCKELFVVFYSVTVCDEWFFHNRVSYISASLD